MTAEHGADESSRGGRFVWESFSTTAALRVDRLSFPSLGLQHCTWKMGVLWADLEADSEHVRATVPPPCHVHSLAAYLVRRTVENSSDMAQMCS